MISDASCAIAHTDDWSTNVDERTTEEILRKVENLSVGKLQKKDLEVLEVLVGLRPARYAGLTVEATSFDLSQEFTRPCLECVWGGGRRTEVRLEKEEFSHGAAKKTVIHNYGHGGTPSPAYHHHSSCALKSSWCNIRKRIHRRVGVRRGSGLARAERAAARRQAAHARPQQPLKTSTLYFCRQAERKRCFYSFSHGAKRRWQHGGRGKEEVVTPA